MRRRNYSDEFKEEAVKLAQRENIRLRRELRRVTEERDILKKAMGIFTKELP